MTLDWKNYVKVEPGEPIGTYSVVPPQLDDRSTLVMEVLRGVLSGRKSLSDYDLSRLGPYSDDLRLLVRDFVTKLPARKLLPRSELLSLAGELMESLRMVGIKEPYVALKPLFDSFGLSDLEFPLMDPDVEEVMVNGRRGMFVYHSQLGHLEFHGSVDLGPVVKRIRGLATKPSVIVDARLPSGERVNLVSPPLSEGYAVTIRKYARRLYNVVSLISTNTISLDAAAYLWLMVEGWGVSPHNIVVAGNAGGGKTTTLNALLDLLPLNQRVITIEDTRELSLLHPNWVPLSGDDLDALLRTALRMRPDRIVVGEVRGKEAETLLAAMNVGHSGMGTIHANSARDAVRRMETPPMNVPSPMLHSLDLIVVQHRINLPGRGYVRRVVQVAEVLPAEGGISLSEVFRWNPERDRLERTRVPFGLVEGLAESLGVSKRDVIGELDRRKKILEFAVRERMNRARLVSLVNTYYLHPERVLKVVE